MGPRQEGLTIGSDCLDCLVLLGLTRDVRFGGQMLKSGRCGSLFCCRPPCPLLVGTAEAAQRCGPPMLFGALRLLLL